MFAYRTFSFVILLGIFFTAVLFDSVIGKGAFLLFATLLAYGGAWEFLNMFEKIKRKSFKKTAGILGIITVLCTFFCKELGVHVYGVLAIIIAASWFSLLFINNNANYFEKIINTITGYVMVLIPLIPLVLIYNYNNSQLQGRFLLLYMILVTKSGDTGAYCVGTLTNKMMGNNHKIIPSISPKKSWEGTIGGMIISTLLSVILWRYMLNLEGLLIPVAAGIVMFIGGFCGDLVESVMKRTTGVKDSNDIIPGMGGVLDVVDSLLLNTPLFYFIFIPLIK